MFLQLFNSFVKSITRHQFRWIRRNKPPRKNIQIRTDITTLNQIKQIRMFRITQIISNTFRTTRHIKDFIQTGFTNIHTHNNNFFTHVRKTNCRITSNKRFTFTRLAGTEKNNFLITSQHKKHVSAKSTEGFFHHVIPILTNNNRTFFGLGTQRYFTQNRNIGDLFHILTVLNLILQQVIQIDNTHRNTQT